MARNLAVRLLCAACLTLAVGPTLRAAVLVISNEANEKMAFELHPDSGEPQNVILAAGESRAFACNKSAEVSFDAEGKVTKLALDAYNIYAFTRRNGATGLHGVKLEGTAPTAGELPTAAHSQKEFKVAVKLLVDDAERRTQAVWERVLKKRFALAADVLKANTGVTFEVTEVGTWDTDPRAGDLKGLQTDFEEVVKTERAALVVGYTSRKFAPGFGETTPKAMPFAGSVVALQSHILIREGDPRSEPDRVEVLVQQLGRYLGAVKYADRASVMRPHLGDGQANSARFQIKFDPLNVLAMNLVADDLRTGKVSQLKDLTSATQNRLGRLYGTLASLTPTEPLPDVYLGLLDRAGIQPPEGVVPAGGIAAAPATAPKSATKVTRTRNAKEEAVRTVVTAVTTRAEANAKLPANGSSTRLKGDDLTAAYIKEAAGAAVGVEKEYREAAFLLGLGIALDDSTILRDNPVTASFCKAVESDDDRRQRIAVLGNPTIRSRRDLCQHFVISAALTEMAGAGLAEQAGVLKEQMDMTKSSGFSFTDLCADFSGIEFAKRVKNNAAELESVNKKFTVADFVPAIDGLRDGISAERFKADFTSMNDAKFKAAYDAVWKRVKEMPVYTEKK
ncbi:hypothetical protein [Limnoglobus roseus]|uniref:Uncharacterized protein n=1 Tax=Limnoglobus roseus TaxID=2598579 RepID=A0A5C1AD52_9BACT|nr:hypothetical protein [Limnoglobus roseus]QEL17231.1 hypothetical protein PX52LOC_04214 [Limnoglobus roseus]